MPTGRKTQYRRRLNRHWIVRLDMNVRSDDVALVRVIVRALNDPDQRSKVRSLLQQHFGNIRSKGLKALLAIAPLEGVDLSRACDGGRAIELGDS
jgi:hypothetical protein